jgi:hypothetical protein
VMGSVDKILFTLKHGNAFLHVQIYVNDIISASSCHYLVSRFQEMMENEFQTSIMEELTFFLGIQVKQMTQGTFVYQAKYTKDLMKKFNMAELKPVSTPMSTEMVLDPDKNGKVVDQREYRSMIGSLLYLTATQPDIQFVVCLCARFQSFSRSSHRTTFSESLGTSNTQLNLGFGILLLLRLILLAFYVDFAGCGIDRKSTSSTCIFLGSSLVC